MCSEDLAESLVEEVGRCVVVLDLSPSFCVYMEAEALCTVCRDALCHMYRKVVLLDGVNDLDLLAAL